eukprot:CAMPEP_0118949442 /NCGR_PEP_ID=MMETSP1169-20130426/49629_1 /TAXON_ID=36882 /ORGANISM="Pyramimonas obovata, Strain CCMP722" /LENGTH=36 /DNA_ID= /DNA_START= /DNA_END= /DNA_ORIENTATION=
MMFLVKHPARIIWDPLVGILPEDKAKLTVAGKAPIR